MATLAAGGELFNLAAAWCSCKIIRFGLDLFLVIEALGTFPAVARRKHSLDHLFPGPPAGSGIF